MFTKFDESTTLYPNYSHISRAFFDKFWLFN